MVLEKGRIVETGLHHELLSQGGLYKKLFEMQFNTQETPKLEDANTGAEKAEGVVTQEPAIDLHETPQHSRWS